MKDQHEKISGYRDLSQEEIDLMNQIKTVGSDLGKLVNELKEMDINRVTNGQISAEEFGEAARWLDIGKNHLQQGVMALIRALAKPSGF